MSNYSNFNYNPAADMLAAVTFFDRVDRKQGGDGIVWVKAIAKKGMQVIVEIKDSRGQRIKIPAIKPGDPVCLSKFVGDFDTLRTAPDLIQNISSKNLRPMTHTEAMEYFAKRAETLKTDPNALIRKSEQYLASQVAQATSNRVTPDSHADRSQRIADQYAAIEEVINPRVEQLCSQVGPMLKDNQRMPVNEFMAELLDLEESLNLVELEYIRAHGYYPTAKKWAAEKQHDVARAQGLIPETDALS